MMDDHDDEMEAMGMTIKMTRRRILYTIREETNLSAVGGYHTPALHNRAMRQESL